MFVCEIMKWINDPFRRCYCLWTKWTVALFSIYGFLSLQRSNWSIDIAANFPFPHTSDQSQFTGLGKKCFQLYREMLCQKSVTLLCPTKRRERLKSSLNTIIIIITTTSIIIIKGGRRRDQREGGLRWASATNADGSVLLLPHLINSLDTIQQQHFCLYFVLFPIQHFHDNYTFLINLLDTYLTQHFNVPGLKLFLSWTALWSAWNWCNLGNQFWTFVFVKCTQH